jgi:hypothetical protein
MKVKLLTTISFFTYQHGISQTEKLLHGKVISQKYFLKNVEVINKTAKTSTTTNEIGNFEILVNLKDSLIFFSKEYSFRRLEVTSENIATNNLLVEMILKPEELNEIIISNNNLNPVRITKDEIKEIKLNSSRPKEGLKIEGYKEAIIPLGVDFIRLGKQIQNILKKEDKIKVEKTQIDFIEFVKTSLSPDFFIKDLRLKPDEKELFLHFCNADPKSKIFLEHPNVLALMDFLFVKNEEFNKLETEINN